VNLDLDLGRNWPHFVLACVLGDAIWFMGLVQMTGPRPLLDEVMK
jgi:hypothetical protein